jgi:hypothetical protein
MGGLLKLAGQRIPQKINNFPKQHLFKTTFHKPPQAKSKNTKRLLINSLQTKSQLTEK